MFTISTLNFFSPFFSNKTNFLSISIFKNFKIYLLRTLNYKNMFPYLFHFWQTLFLGRINMRCYVCVRWNVMWYSLVSIQSSHSKNIQRPMNVIEILLVKEKKHSSTVYLIKIQITSNLWTFTHWRSHAKDLTGDTLYTTLLDFAQAARNSATLLCL